MRSIARTAVGLHPKSDGSKMQTITMKPQTTFQSIVPSNELLKDAFNAFAWTVLLGLPLFALHMLILDYEHYQHGMTLEFSLEMSLKNMIPYHPISLGLWLAAVFITAFSVRRVLRQQREVLLLQNTVEKIKQDVVTDSLTGLLNRRAFDEGIRACLDFSEYSGQPFTLIMMDIDQFKSINDQQGHVAGDKALRVVADHLRNQVRAQDVLARFGGDEFAIICPGMGSEDAWRMAKRLKNASPSSGINLSIGHATYPADGKTITDIIRRADKELYREKRLHHSLMPNLDAHL